MEEEQIKKSIGLLLVLAGLIILVYENGWLRSLSYSTNTLAIAPKGVGISISVSPVQKVKTLSTVGKGYSYKWKVSVSNTGSVYWDDAWIITRLGIKDSKVSVCTASGLIGKYYCESCQYGKDTDSCRIDITSWGFAYSLDGKHWTTGCPGNKWGKTCHLDLKTLGILPAPGHTSTVYLKLTPPSTAENGVYPLITDGRIYVNGVTYSIEGSYDYIHVGEITGGINLELIGALSLIAGLVILWILK